MQESAKKEVFIRPYEESDFEDFLILQQESPFMHLMEQDLVRQSVRKTLDERNYECHSVFEKDTMQYCGNIELHLDTDEPYPELGITLLSKQQNRGIGSSALRNFCNECLFPRGIKALLIRIEPGNSRSKHLFEKLGAKSIGKSLLPVMTKLFQQLGKPLPDPEEAGVDTFLLELPIKDENGS